MKPGQKKNAKKYCLLSVAAMLCLAGALVPARAQAVDWQRYSANMLSNESFENGLTGWQVPQEMTQLSSEAHSGATSLQFTNTDSTVYKVITQSGHAQPGQSVALSAWMKGENVRSDDSDSGATIYIAALDAAGKDLGGSYRSGFLGSFGWTLKTASYTFPKGTAGYVFGLYMRRGTTGRVWFDDVSLRSENADYAPVNAQLVYPNYRGLTTVTNHKTWKLRLTSDFPYDWEQVPARSSIIDSGGRELYSETLALSPNSREDLTLTFDPKDKVREGDYSWKIVLNSPRLNKNNSFSLPIHVRRQMPRTYIDSEGFTVIDGKRFFPFGVYVNGLTAATDTDLKRLAGAGFNTLLSYRTGVDSVMRSYFDRAALHKLKVIYSIKDMYDAHLPYPVNGLTGLQHAEKETKFWREHPALLAWYINDELGPEWAPQIERMYGQTADLDPQHPAFQVMVKPKELPHFFASADAWGTDPYPISGKDARPLRYVANLTRETVGAAQNAKAVWQVLQIFDNGIYVKNEGMRPPTLQEMRNMTYQALINGSKGVIYYSYSDLYYKDWNRDPALANQDAFNKRWPEVEAMAREIAPLTAVIVEDRKVTLQADADSIVQHQAWQNKGALHIAVVNTEAKAGRLSLQIPSGWRYAKQQPHGITANLSRGTLTLQVPAQGSGVIELKR